MRVRLYHTHPEGASLTTDEARAWHTQDEECAPGEDGYCVCGAWHGSPCADCGGRAFHRPDCPEQIRRDREYEDIVRGGGR